MSDPVEVVDRPNTWKDELALFLHPHDGKCDFCGHHFPLEEGIELVAWSRLSPPESSILSRLSIPFPHPYRVCSQECFGCVLRELTGAREVEWSVQ